MPGSTPRVIGHAAVFDRFRRTLRRGRLASTYLFVGPRGVGKRRVAERLAAALLCEAPADDGAAPCGVCRSCRLLAGGAHPDLLAVGRPEGKSSLPLELFLGAPDARNRAGLCHDLALRPMVSSRRVAIIDDADHLGVESANCLLKTLEEPPPRSVLMLIGTSLARQLPTIRSRAQVVRFAGLDPPDVARVLTDPPHSLSADEAAALADASGGSVAAALAAADPSRREACDAVVACLDAPRVDPSRLARTLDDGAKSAGAEPRQRREHLSAMVGAAADHYRRRLREASACDATLAALDACLDADEALSRNANQTAVSQRLAIQLARTA